MFQRSLLDWLLPIWTLSPVCEIRDKMQAVYKELTYDRLKFKVTKSKFDSSKTSKRGIIAWKIH